MYPLLHNLNTLLKVSYMMHTGTCGCLEGRIQVENSKSPIWADAKQLVIIAFIERSAKFFELIFQHKCECFQHFLTKKGFGIIESIAASI
jgi:hypothetical protein